MTKYVAILSVMICMFSIAYSQSGIKKIMFGRETVLADTVRFDKIFNILTEDQKRFFFYENRITSTVRTSVNGGIYDIYPGEIIELNYFKGYADSTYNIILGELIKRKRNRDFKEDQFFGLFKPGMFILLDNKNDRLFLLNFNLCALPKVRMSLIKHLKPDLFFTKKLLVNCGVFNFNELSK